MKFLFIVQGEGRGHFTQALAMEEMLLRNGHEVVEILVGKAIAADYRGSLTATLKRRSNDLLVPISCRQQKINVLV